MFNIEDFALMLENFAVAHRLRTKKASCGEPLIVPGNPRRSEDISHIYPHDETTLVLLAESCPLLARMNQ